jgi:hypothetical protein
MIEKTLHQGIYFIDKIDYMLQRPKSKSWVSK